MPTIHTIYPSQQQTNCCKPLKSFHHNFTTLLHTNVQPLFGTHCTIPIKEIAYGSYHELYNEINNEGFYLFNLQGGINNDPFTIYLGSGSLSNPTNPNIPIIIGQLTAPLNGVYKMILDTNQIIPYVAGYKYQIAAGDTCLSTPFELLS